MKKKVLTFQEGVWFAVEYLVVERDEPGFAADIIISAGMTVHDCRKIMRRTKYETKLLSTFLRNEFPSPAKRTKKK